MKKALPYGGSLRNQEDIPIGSMKLVERTKNSSEGNSGIQRTMVIRRCGENVVSGNFLYKPQKTLTKLLFYCIVGVY
jgi:hypothetical protein